MNRSGQRFTKTVQRWTLHSLGLLALSHPDPALSESREVTGPVVGTVNTKAITETAEETFQGCRTQLRQLLESEMESELSQLARTAGLADSAIASLQATSAALVERTLAETAPKMREFISDLSEWRRVNKLGSQPLGVDVFSPFFSRRFANLGFPRNATVPPQFQIPSPWKEKAWTEKVDALLTADQRKAIADHMANDSAQLEKNLKSISGGIRKRLGIEAAILQSRIERAIELEPERLDRFHDLLERALDQGTSTTLDRIRNFIEGLPRNSRDQWQGNVGNISSFDFDIETDALWKEGIAALLSPMEQETVRSSMKDRLARLNDALIDLAVRELDNRCHLSAVQRTAVRPLIERALEQENMDAPNPESKMGPATLFSGVRNRTRNACNNVPEDELRKVLDKAQLTAWAENREKSDPTTNRRGYTVRQRNGRPPASTASPPASTDPETLIQDHLMRSTESQRSQLRTAMLAKVGEISRLAQVDPAHAERLRTAALGAVEFHLKNWKPNFENNLRANLHNVRPENLAQRLGEFDFFMMGGSPLAPMTQPIWKTAYNSELSESQRQTLTDITRQRQEELAKMVSALTTWIFERHTALRPNQIPPVRELVAKAVLEYLPDLEQTYGSEDSESPWYNHLHSVVLPLFGVPETDLKRILTPSQWERWSKSELHNSFGGNWTNLKSLHESRKVRQKN